MVSATPITADMNPRAGTNAPARDAEVFVVRAETRAALARRVGELADGLARRPDTSLADLSFTLAPVGEVPGSRVALVARTAAELHGRLSRTAERLADPSCTRIKDTQGIYYFEQPLWPDGKIALLFPGAGAQYPNMLADLVPYFPELRDQFALCDRLAGRSPGEGACVSRLLLAAPEEEGTAALDLWQPGNAFASVVIANAILHQLLRECDVPADAVAGHSLGENSALWAAGCIDFHDLMGQVATLRQAMARLDDDAGAGRTVLLAVMTGRSEVETLVRGSEPTVCVAMDNCPHQTILAGETDAISRMEAKLRDRGVVSERLPLYSPFHTPLFRPLLPAVARAYESLTFRAARIPVYSCSTGQHFPADPEAIRRQAIDLWHSPVEFSRAIETMYADGMRLFVEVGPRGNLSAFVEDILRGRTFLAVPANVSRRSGLHQFCTLLAQLAAHHVPLCFGPLYRHRAVDRVGWAERESAACPTSARASVVERHLVLMDQFLDQQREMTELYLASARRRAVPQPFGSPVSQPAPPSAVRQRGPMLGQTVRHDPGRFLVAHRRLDLAEDRFARDHTLGGRHASAIDPDQHGLPVMPMVFSMEMMAEAAQVLVPDKRLIGFRAVRLHRWLPYEDEPGTVAITARRHEVAAGEPVRVAVEIVNLAEVVQPGKTPSAVVSGTVLLADDYHEPPACDGFPLTDEGPSPISPEQLYQQLFHGPRFHAVYSTDRLGREGIEGQLTTLPHADLFRSTTAPDLLTDPLLLDAATHLLGCWHLSQPDQAGRVVFPQEVGALDIFGPRPETGSRVTCRVLVEETTRQRIRHRIDLIGPDGRLWCRMGPAIYWRFYLPREFVQFLQSKERHFLGQAWPVLPGTDDLLAGGVRLEIPDAVRQSGLLGGLAHVVLSPTERRAFRELSGPDRRRVEWLFGRIAAKDAVRLLWHRSHGEHLFAADIEIQPDPHGRPLARDRSDRRQLPTVSIAHTEDFVVALAAEGAAAGVDVEQIKPRSPGFEDIAFSPAERQLLDRFGSARDEWIARFWCAREAVSKALGRGQIDGPRSLEVCQADVVSGAVEVSLGERLAAEFPDLRGVRLVAHTLCAGDLVVVSTFCRRAETCSR